jgi:DNA (cytosine-5)-methyltransferase 1
LRPLRLYAYGDVIQGQGGNKRPGVGKIRVAVGASGDNAGKVQRSGDKTSHYFLDLFSGIGGFALGEKWAGLEFYGRYFSEIDKYAVKTYKMRFHGAKNLGDVRYVNYGKLPKGDWFASGGFPCQPHSVVGKRKASQDERDLCPECRRMLRELRPRAALFENVPGLLTSDGGRFFNRVLSDIHKCGYDAEWKVVSAAEIGALHLRKSVWIVCCKQAGAAY